MRPPCMECNKANISNNYNLTITLCDYILADIRSLKRDLHQILQPTPSSPDRQELGLKGVNCTAEVYNLPSIHLILSYLNFEAIDNK